MHRAFAGFLILILFMLGDQLQADLIIKDGSIKNENTGPVKFDTNNDGTQDITFTQDGKVGVGVSSPAHTFDLAGSFGMIPQTVSTNTTLSGNSLVLVDTSVGGITLTLPLASSMTGRFYEIKKINDNNALVVLSQDSVEALESVTLTTSVSGFAYVNLFSDGSKWHVRSQSIENAYFGSDNLVGWWKLDETSGTTANDSSPQGLDGTLTGGVDFSSDSQVGKIDNALNFDGSADYISVPDSEAIGGNTQSGFSVSIWLKSDIVLSTTGGGRRVLEKGDCYFFLQGNGTSTGSGGMNFLVKRSDSNYTADIGVALNSGQWYHLVGTFDGSDIKVYLDGVLKDTTSVGGDIDDDNLPLRIGSDDGGAFFDGLVDDVRIYDRALNVTEVQTIYTLGQ